MQEADLIVRASLSRISMKSRQVSDEFSRKISPDTFLDLVRLDLGFEGDFDRGGCPHRRIARGHYLFALPRALKGLGRL